MRGRIVRGGVLLATAVAFAAILAPSAMATSPLVVSKTAEGKWTRTFEWTIDKSVTPAVHDMLTGQSGTSTYTIVLTKSAGVDSDVTVEGEVCVQNTGAVATQGLAISDRIVATVPGGSLTIASGNLDLSANPVLDPGESYCYPYSFVIEPVANATGYFNDARITITNDPREPGVPLGPSTTAAFSIPATPTLINNTVNVDDTNPAGDAGPFSSSTSYTYTRTFTCDRDAGTHPNTATIVETGQSDSASVTVRCTPPGNEGCTPGYWKNHPESYGGTGVTSASKLASVGFNVNAALSFQQALELTGGGLNALLRHAAAAYLNAASPSVDYPRTTAQVVAMTNAAIASGNYEATKNQFDTWNNLGSPGFCD